MSRLATAIKSGKTHSAIVFDQCQAMERLTSKIKNPVSKNQFHLLVASMKKECNIIQAKLEKAEREGEDISVILKSFGEEAKKQRMFSKASTWRHASIINLKQPLIVLAHEITISSQ